MIILYDGNGKECKFYFPVDAKQAIQSGYYFETDPRLDIKVPEVEEVKEPEVKDVKEPEREESEDEESNEIKEFSPRFKNKKK